jgi:hypothetical protein
MSFEIIGPELWERNAQGQLRSQVGTLFPRHRLLVTVPGIHASQRLAFVDHLNRQREAAGEAPLSGEAEQRESEQSVDLFLESERILIRPDPEHMELAFAADELLQERVSKRKIMFLFAYDPKVQSPIKERGEYWRISPLPHSPAEMRAHISESRVAIHEGAIYYYSRTSGTRYVTFQQFAGLESLPHAALARQLREIADHARSRNRLGNPEVAFFEANKLLFSAEDFTGLALLEMSEADLRACHARLCERFRAATAPLFLQDEPLVEGWRNRMFMALASPPDTCRAEEMLRGLSPEFFLQIEWVAGGRFEEGEFILDPLYQEAEANAQDETLQRLCDPKARRFIFNFIREFGDLDYVNVGHIGRSLSKRAPSEGRRDVYIAELKPRHATTPLVRFLRLLKWGVAERLDEGKDLLGAILGTEEYIDFLLDRRLGCRQVGMNLPSQITIRRVTEVYSGTQAAWHGQVLHTPYSERDYIRGVATDKLPPTKLADEAYATTFAGLLGKAAACNLIVGRTYDEGKTVIFDDGDEVVIEDANGLPLDLIVGDHSGAFGEYRRPLSDFARDYARPVNARADKVAHPRQFAEAYLEAFRTQFLHVQREYRRYRRAFDTLFQHCNYDPAGSFAYRWECVLKRLDRTDADGLVQAIRAQIAVLPVLQLQPA